MVDILVDKRLSYSAQQVVCEDTIDLRAQSSLEGLIVSVDGLYWHMPAVLLALLGAEEQLGCNIVSAAAVSEVECKNTVSGDYL